MYAYARRKEGGKAGSVSRYGVDELYLQKKIILAIGCKGSPIPSPMADGPSWPYRTAVASLCVQIIVGGVTAASAALSKSPELGIVINLELGSQLVEFAWYALVVVYYRRILTWTRYIDWVISTPLMLLSLALFFQYRAGVPQDTWPSIAGVLCLNALMLACGFAFELGAVAKWPGLVGGSVALLGSFGLLFARFVDPSDALSVWTYAINLAVWSLYGVAASLPDVSKNVSYNALDIVSKNVLGVFLFVYVLVEPSA